MMRLTAFLLFVFLGMVSCAQKKESVIEKSVLSLPDYKMDRWINPEGQDIETRFLLPDGYGRQTIKSSSFQTYLRKLPLKEHGALVMHFDGSSKPNQGIYDAVVDLPIGKRDLHQCADAIMRLRAEYLFAKGAYDQIHFNFTNGFRVDYKEWMKGKRIKVDGNKVLWVASKSPSNTYADFWKYMETIFSYAGTLSLDKELDLVLFLDMEIGDVFIRGGSPGHAVIVVDMVENKTTSKKKFLLAQSYMPAQEIQILKNPANQDGSPWYDLVEEVSLQTPEWLFKKDQLKRFE